jgi:hypothetical protein
METFTYTSKSKTKFYNGCVFDSSLELKFALMIEETNAWLRDGLEIYYNLNQNDCGVKANLPCYRPDFLIRNWSTGEAQLIEIKPDGFNCDSLKMRQKIASRLINRFAYDWSFRVITESQINLSPEQLKRYENILATQNDWTHKPGLHLLQNDSSLSDDDYRQFVTTGFLQAVFP